MSETQSYWLRGKHADFSAVRERVGVQGDDSELSTVVVAAQRGDERAFERLYRELQPRLLGYVRTIVADRDAEDVASETWLHISRDLVRFRGDADRFRGWTTRIARNRALDHVRASGRKPVVLTDDSSLGERASRADTATEALDAVATANTFAMLGRLPKEQAEAVALRTVLGLDARRAAVLLGSRPGAVRTATHRGLRRLAEWVDPAAEHPLLGGHPTATNREIRGAPRQAATHTS